MRFIPTYVGHTSPALLGLLGETVHPHIRGAYEVLTMKKTNEFGSSPHTWGILKRLQQFREHRRFIPTYVGHTDPESRGEYQRAVHPHIRGAYGGQLIRICHFFGSSPHTWGIRSGQGSGVRLPRFIPTYVGHTEIFCTRSRLPAVHPHIRGAYAGMMK